MEVLIQLLPSQPDTLSQPCQAEHITHAVLAVRACAGEMTTFCGRSTPHKPKCRSGPRGMGHQLIPDRCHRALPISPRTALPHTHFLFPPIIRTPPQPIPARSSSRPSQCMYNICPMFPLAPHATRLLLFSPSKHSHSPSNSVHSDEYEDLGEAGREARRTLHWRRSTRAGDSHLRCGTPRHLSRTPGRAREMCRVVCTLTGTINQLLCCDGSLHGRDEERGQRTSRVNKAGSVGAAFDAHHDVLDNEQVS